MANMQKYDVGLIDGQNLFYKSFATQGDLSTMIDFKEVRTGGTFGFIQSLISLKKNYLKPEAVIIVAWDKGHDKRTQIYPAYKANRPAKNEWNLHEDFKTQREALQRTLNILGIAQAFKQGEEADDIIGTLAWKRQQLKHNVLIMSADKDFQQLIDTHIDLLAHKGKGNIKLWTDELWEAENGFHPSKFTHILGIKGDSGDNIPGVRGIGDVGAYDLVQNSFDTLDTILNDKSVKIDIPDKGPLKKVLEQVDSYRLSYKLALIDRHVEGVKINRGKKDMEHLETLFCLYQFNEFMKSENWRILETL